jgi:hypothetical protein
VHLVGDETCIFLSSVKLNVINVRNFVDLFRFVANLDRLAYFTENPNVTSVCIF